ncbi:MAG: cytochrome c [Crocinitomicaceae bacterium]|nr:cytochrome c [Flavobacteriales bacterium]NQZ34643.1 cytochrome c [Crocinitomicaceae bacterium]
MQRIILLSFTLIATVALVTSLSTGINQGKIDRMDPNSYSVEEVLNQLGNERLIHSITQVDLAKAKIGEDLIFNGFTLRDGKKSKRISTYFVCTDCHNTTREFDDASSELAEDRLHYAKENGLPFLPGSTLWGIYNRTSFYNDDYVEKYGDLVINARDSLANAVQLCSKYCSSGRYIDDWEMEAIMHYFKKNELHLSDLDIPDKDKNALMDGRLSQTQKENLSKAITNSYRQAYSATFMETMDRAERPYGDGGNAENGKLIYKKACMFCHENKRVTYLHLDDGKLSGLFLWRNRKKYTDQSIYQIVRHGTYSKVGRKQYMPHFTKEKMSDDQLNDLVAYIKQIAKR